MRKNLNYSFLFDFYGDLLRDKQRDVIDYYYNDDLSLAEIAEHMDITRQGVHDLLKRTEQALLEYEKILGLYSQSLLNETLIAEINDDIQKLKGIYESPEALKLLENIQFNAQKMGE